MQYPSSAGPLPAVTAAPTPRSYKLRAWGAVAALVAFLGIYFGLAGWFAWTAWRLGQSAFAGRSDGFWAGLVALCAALLAVFMLKALFFRQRRAEDHSLEIQSSDQPALFVELNAIADAVGAPRPHRVLVSARVNAAVFYDLSPLNLLWPTKKDLEIGLGLVNVLNRSELRAVLAHEFGHFAQRAMAVGRWVYVAQQIAARLVAQRDMLDRFLQALSRFDFRIAWVGWVLSVIVWAIRSLVDSVFTGVQLLQRSLGREMEYGADAVAVALTGSDALVHALYKLQTADMDWDRAAGVAGELRAKEQWVGDLFALQAAISERTGRMLDDADYGRVPAAQGGPSRLFDTADSAVPQMWRTHPLNHEREARAKANYRASEVDERSAWTLFENAAALREQVTRRLIEAPGSAQPMDEAALQAALDERFGGELLQPRYRGAYLGRALTRHVAEPGQLVGALPGAAEGIQRLAALYPASLGEAVRRWRRIDADKEPAEHAELLAELRRHDEAARAAHLALARVLGDGSEARLRGLLAQLHYTEHTTANLRDLRGVLAHTVHVLTVGRITNAVRDRVLGAAEALHEGLMDLHGQAGLLRLDAATLKRLEVQSWPAALGEFKLQAPDYGNLGDWLNVIDGWMDGAEHALNRLRGALLGELLAAEDRVARGEAQPAAAETPAAPPRYVTLLEGAERPRDLSPSLWARFLAAQGRGAAAARIAVAGGIVVGVLGFGGGYGDIGVQVLNGLDRPVRVRVGGASAITLPAFGSATVGQAPDAHLPIVAETEQGELIERVEVALEHGPGRPVYNVAGAAPLVELTYTYGRDTGSVPPRMLGAQRWVTSQADVFFGDPPHSVSVKQGQTETRRVLHSAADAMPGLQLSLLGDDTAAAERVSEAHLHWDRRDSPLRLIWLSQLQGRPAHDKLLAAALAREPASIELQRERFDTLPADELKRVCGELGRRAAAADADGNAVYLAARCLPDGPVRDAALVAGLSRFPQHPWLAYGAAWAEAGNANWRVALRNYELARAEPTLAPFATVEANRLRRLLGEKPLDSVAERIGPPSRLQAALGIKEQAGTLISEPEVYASLAAGRLDQVLQLAPNPHALRLAAASDGASLELRGLARGLSADQGLDRDTYWTALALAERERWTLPALPKGLPGVDAQEQAKLEAFRAALHSPATLAGAERHLQGLSLELRGQAYSMATVLLGERTPPAWREAAKRLLLSHERPYFN
ncbi:Zn-dependent protease with chaperone function [Pelomonas saccharophila]|uniref:Zn-dependent protease with chaperone function n=1 Tax=Roseateles saccharophilus TaxID=304 RepID=A0ABU1YMB8_ROSSA|nr:M48 family metallopeptidase [Roseateles saccharophilus]MDR7269141.1 Zn-dependent protease with chaperone function [Roseateles saccharophilus]